MKKMMLPQKQAGYIPKGIYALPQEKRRSAFEQLANGNSRNELADYRTAVRKRMRGEF